MYGRHRMEQKEKIIQTILSLSGSWSLYDIFTDWVTCSTLSIQNAVSFYQDQA